MKKIDIGKFIKDNPVYVRAGVIVTLSIMAFAAVYTVDQNRMPEKNSDGREILKRGDHGQGEEDVLLLPDDGGRLRLSVGEVRSFQRVQGGPPQGRLQAEGLVLILL